MNKPNVDELLTGSAQHYAASTATRAALDALVGESRQAGARHVAPVRRTRTRSRAAWLIPGAILALGALTAGAVVIDDLLRADLPIAVEYTTDSGVAVSCTAQIQGGSLFSPHRAEVITYYETHDFSGVGQQIYEYALVLTRERTPSSDLMPRSSEWVPAAGDEVPDASAFSQSLSSFLLTDTLIELDISGSGDASLQSDCTGQLR